MAQSLTKASKLHVCFIKCYLSVICGASIARGTAPRLIYERELVPSENFRKLQVSDVCYNRFQNSSIQHFCTSINQGSLCWEGSSHDVLLRKLEISLKGHQIDEAWEAYMDFKSLFGFPNHALVSRLVTVLSYSSDPKWLQRACILVLSTVEEKSDLIKSDLLTKLSLSLARAQMSVPASIVLRLMLEKERLPPINILGLVILHMVKTEIGMHLASNILVEICNCFQRLSANKSTRAKLTKPDTMIFNLVLGACVRFGSSFKGQKIIELMAEVGVIADAHTIIIIARIYQMNGQRDELKKFKDHIDWVSIPFVHHYRQFYDSLLSLHFQSNDMDAAFGLVLDMYRCKESLLTQEDRREPQKPCLVPVGSHNLWTGLSLQILPRLLQKDSVLQVEGKEELVMHKNGKLVLSNKALAKFIIRYRRYGMISQLSKLLSSIQKKLGSFEEDNMCSDVIGSCIHLGWLETAHDILEDLETAGASLGASSYASLLTAYYKGKMFKEAEALLRQIQKAGLLINMSDEMLVSTHFSELEDKRILHPKMVTKTAKSDLVESIVREMREEEKAVPFTVKELNSSIYFFMKAKMIEDAQKTYQRMQKMKIQPTVSTFFTLVSGYSSMEMYRKITIVWGDIKRNMENGNLGANRDLFELLLLNFLRGGYFERVMEVIGYMKKYGMYMDKCMYKSEFLKFHKDLYRSLKASSARSEAQSKRIEHVCAFRKWADIH